MLWNSKHRQTLKWKMRSVQSFLKPHKNKTVILRKMKKQTKMVRRMTFNNNNCYYLHIIVSINDIKNITDPLSKVEAGLKVDGADVPLQAVHIRAQLIDLSAKVTQTLIIIQ